MNRTWCNNDTQWLWERVRGSYPGPRATTRGRGSQGTGHSTAGWEIQCAVAPEETYEVPEGFLGHALSVTGTARARFPRRLTPPLHQTIRHRTPLDRRHTNHFTGPTIVSTPDTTLHDLESFPDPRLDILTSLWTLTSAGIRLVGNKDTLAPLSIGLNNKQNEINFKKHKRYRKKLYQLH